MHTLVLHLRLVMTALLLQGRIARASLVKWLIYLVCQ